MNGSSPPTTRSRAGPTRASEGREPRGARLRAPGRPRSYPFFGKTPRRACRAISLAGSGKSRRIIQSSSRGSAPPPTRLFPRWSPKLKTASPSRHAKRLSGPPPALGRDENSCRPSRSLGRSGSARAVPRGLRGATTSAIARARPLARAREEATAAARSRVPSGRRSSACRRSAPATTKAGPPVRTRGPGEARRRPDVVAARSPSRRRRPSAAISRNGARPSRPRPNPWTPSPRGNPDEGIHAPVEERRAGRGWRPPRSRRSGRSAVVRSSRGRRRRAAPGRAGAAPRPPGPEVPPLPRRDSDAFTVPALPTSRPSGRPAGGLRQSRRTARSRGSGPPLRRAACRPDRRGAASRAPGDGPELVHRPAPGPARRARCPLRLTTRYRVRPGARGGPRAAGGGRRDARTVWPRRRCPARASRRRGERAAEELGPRRPVLESGASTIPSGRRTPRVLAR